MAPSSPLPASTATRPAFARWMGTTNQITRTFLAAGAIPGLINVAGGLPDPTIFPTERLAEFARRAVAEHPDEVLSYGPVEGLAALRDALARRFGSPALPLTRDNVLVTTSGMQGLDLIGKVLLEDGGLVAGQYPTYLGALDAWRPRAPSFRNLVLEAPGFDPFEAVAGAQFAYAVPNFSNPTGRMVDLATRRALVAAAHRTGTWLVEDDPYGTLHYDGAALPRLIELSAQAAPGEPYAGPVISMGTLSKEIAPGLRVGWVVAAPAMIEALTLAKQGSDLCTSGVTQRVALAAIESGLVDEIRPALVALYRSRRDALCAALSAHLSDWFDWEVPVGGMFVWAVAKDPALDTDALLPHALSAGICFSPSSVFDATGANRRGMRLNFTLNPPERLDEGMRRLATAVAALRRSRGGAA
ncbi:PLP-dependent aminotransferase family protein [Methylobacterium terrae]|uniref:8-amino-7-oxononanoate synthase n=1 Tax=Methylobacterium terrae TaxID=2202827 RepID=A0A2U8WKJ3_9HYPH|nr:PLP-dependent aminotransferase family protein [Methylobacterium terrae]AWN46765.1 PLP-dependent aminotransferase family protein [Methylobacterium terrae]